MEADATNTEDSLALGKQSMDLNIEVGLCTARRVAERCEPHVLRCGAGCGTGRVAGVSSDRAQGTAVRIEALPRHACLPGRPEPGARALWRANGVRAQTDSALPHSACTLAAAWRTPSAAASQRVGKRM